MRLRSALLPLALAALAAPGARAQAPCDGFATDPHDGTLYPCENAALLSRLPLDGMGVPVDPTTGLPYRGNDIWGWVDPQTERAYALVGNMSGVYFVDVTDPADPLALGALPTADRSTTWRSVKVYADHAFVVADLAGDHGMQVFDLTRLRGLDPDPQRRFDADALYTGADGHFFDSAHNVAVNEDTGFAYVVGSPDCAGGLHMVDVRDPLNPAFAGCFAEDDYTHDAQCVIYHGPDPDYQGREICVVYQGRNPGDNHVAFVDVTDKAAPVLLSTAYYPNAGYTHQGWFDADQRYLYVNDELDELFGLVPGTRTIRLDVLDLDAPEFEDEHFYGTDATDHNLYVHGDVVFASNNRSGLRFLQIQSWVPEDPPWGEVGFLDTHPEGDAAGFEGAWSVYPFLPALDGGVPLSLVSDRTRGLFVIAGPLALATAGEPAAPAGFHLALAPSPFTTRTTLSLTVAAPQRVRVTLYDALGRRLAIPFDGALAAGASHEIAVDGRSLPPGRYLLRVEGERFAATRPLVRVR